MIDKVEAKCIIFFPKWLISLWSIIVIIQVKQAYLMNIRLYLNFPRVQDKIEKKKKIYVKIHKSPGHWDSLWLGNVLKSFPQFRYLKKIYQTLQSMLRQDFYSKASDVMRAREKEYNKHPKLTSHGSPRAIQSWSLEWPEWGNQLWQSSKRSSQGSAFKACHVKLVRPVAKDQ